MKKIKTRFAVLLFALVLFSTGAFARVPDTADQIISHGGLYTSTTSYTDLGAITVISITYYCNDGTSITTRDWWWN